MEALSEAQILDIWERGRGRGAAEQALVPLRVAWPELAAEELAALPLGERDRRLLELRRATLGAQLQGTADCPRCGSRVSFGVEVEDILGADSPANPPADAAAASPANSGAAPGRFSLAAEGYQLVLRSLDTADLSAAAKAASLEEARRILLERALVEARHGTVRIEAGELPEPLLAAIDAALEARDPLAVVPLAMTCTHCGAHWQPLLDSAAFVWREVEARAERVMNDVHELAQHYGWTEEQILRISPARRQFYLDLAPAQRVLGEEEGGARA